MINENKTRFAILKHTQCLGKEDHYDIVVEVFSGTNPEEIALAKYESLTLGRTIEAMYERDVRRKYLTYEGSMGENRGEVFQVHSGICRKLQDGTMLLCAKNFFGKLKVK